MTLPPALSWDAPTAGLTKPRDPFASPMHTGQLSGRRGFFEL